MDACAAPAWIRTSHPDDQIGDEFQGPRPTRRASLYLDITGVLRTMDAVRRGVHPRTLYAMRDAGLLERLGRGLYRLADLPPRGNPDLVTVALRVPEGVLCLISALAFHELATQIPHEVYVALKRGGEPPRLDHPPVRIFWFTGKAFTDGIETHVLDGVNARVYGAAKTVADCFKYRNKLGLDTAIEALRLFLEEKRGSPAVIISTLRGLCFPGDAG